MRKFLDTASIAQSLDGERLMGCLQYPQTRYYSPVCSTTRTRMIKNQSLIEFDIFSFFLVWAGAFACRKGARR
jgi:hypothetical protein